ncbi:serine/threonine protein phosphatase 1 [Mycoplana sp. BE70]|uniref:metallophosphoesterase n=1 Tax=Mycoplana sp. BE70 TaxID=2817775 RepID=UPI00285B6DA3|nr:metallophosphoesterase [Mycoplana sp. BE70]MDR6755513.1 serine/threonine protein phosphatase 1 [Mycoplana sp. BE70]
MRLDGPLPSIYAIGDVHGCYREVLEAEARIRVDLRSAGNEALVVYLGDYVDRGPAAASVLDHLTREHHDGLTRVTLCGNHDDIFLQFIRDPVAWGYWLGPNFGGEATLASYGISLDDVRWRELDTEALSAWLRRIIPARHIMFLAGLPVLLTVGNYVFVHAGLRPGIPLEAQEDEDLLWIREPFLIAGSEPPQIVVHGHTPCSNPEFARGRIGIDTGCFATGRLTVLKIDAAGARLL